MVGRIGKWVAGFGVVAVMMGVAGCSSGPRGPLTVPMVFRPTDPVDVGVSEGMMTKSATVEVVDARTEKKLIGANREKDTETVDVLAGSAPTEFVKRALEHSLQAAGVVVKPDGGADRKIVVSLTQFWVNETNTYNSNVAASVKVVSGNGGGQTLWEGQSTGGNTRFGRSLKAENYQETLSDATVQMCNRLLRTEGFRGAMK